MIKGAAVGALVVIPLSGLTVWALGALGIGRGDANLAASLRAAVFFGGIPCLLTCAGIGRLAARASVLQGIAAATWSASRTLAIAHIGLCLLAATALTALPEGIGQWAVLAALAGGTGALAGAALGRLCAVHEDVAIADVVALARWPHQALRRAATAVGLADDAPPDPPSPPPAQPGDGTP